ncbi:protein lifeguard 1-like isoform X1 [Daphnia pulicaria]|uniref:protein lifeguard 1-like isoform X1 n=1 Tax=Daphnia pulicaria TaxID=35523 RepID=UPI001EECE068|nr:protein lifeguard 1-like isoform X1 [Daphnia pulicaria]XP_046653754.1 protein lifeguard 1-like isoform X1 [Daphnia pulicaria]XP_046653755.1 protein lifeguard 1-like isoform X1 [Daphnia pulicaria]XP_046653756.1 protein lifeguard 1-like isoform X1 [Daphnia pulicaria]
MAFQPNNPTYSAQPGQPSSDWAVPGVDQGPPPQYINPISQPPDQQPPLDPDNKMYGVAESGGLGDAAFAFSDQSIRMVFVRKVYSILMVQLAITVAIISLFVYEPSVQLYAFEHPEMWLITFLMAIGLIIVLARCHEFRRRWPLNLILLGLFTLCEGFLLGTLSASNESEEVLIAVGICSAVCFALTIFAMQTKWDFTAYGGILFVCAIVLIIFGIVAICIPGDVTQLVYASLGALLFSVYLVYDTQLMLGGKHKHSISPEEYIFAALTLYVDIINIFQYVLSLLRFTRK